VRRGAADFDQVAGAVCEARMLAPGVGGRAGLALSGLPVIDVVDEVAALDRFEE
jgi:hypothetical protein